VRDAPLRLDALARVEALLRAQPEVERVTSILDPLRRLHPLLGGEGALPSSVEAIEQELLLVDDGRRLRALLTRDRRAAAVHAQVRDLGSDRVRDLLARLEPALPPGVELTGLPVVMQGVFDGLVGDLATSFGAAVLWALVTFAVVFRSLRWGLVAVIPNALPMVFALATMAALGIALKPSTVMVFSLAFAVAADDTVHLVSRFLALRLPAREAAARALQDAGLPIIVTSTALTVGFAALGLSEFQALSTLGLLLGVALGSAAVVEVLLTPTLLVWFAPRRESPPA
jgi:uncharacterized protein